MNRRRSFLKKSEAVAALSLTASTSSIGSTRSRFLLPVKDMGLDMCLAYFWGIEPRKVALAKRIRE